MECYICYVYFETGERYDLGGVLRSHQAPTDQNMATPGERLA